jgi:DNA-binding MarR family transcriptional regulator
MAQPKTTRPSASDAIRALQGTAYREHSSLLYTIHELSRLISTRADKGMAQHRLTHAQWWALMHIFESGEGKTQTELAELLQLGRASTGKLLERLEAKRWIERRDDASDSRVRRIYLTAAVVPVFKHMTEEGKRLFETFLEGISPAEEALIIAGLRKIKANAERSAEGD